MELHESTALIWALRSNNENMVKILPEHNADPNLQSAAARNQLQAGHAFFEVFNAAPASDESEAEEEKSRLQKAQTGKAQRSMALSLLIP